MRLTHFNGTFKSSNVFATAADRLQQQVVHSSVIIDDAYMLDYNKIKIKVCCHVGDDAWSFSEQEYLLSNADSFFSLETL